MFLGLELVILIWIIVEFLEKLREILKNVDLYNIFYTLFNFNVLNVILDYDGFNKIPSDKSFFPPLFLPLLFKLLAENISKMYYFFFI